VQCLSFLYLSPVHIICSYNVYEKKKIYTLKDLERTFFIVLYSMKTCSVTLPIVLSFIESLYKILERLPNTW